MLLRQEFQLARAELKQELVKSGKAAGALGAAAFAGQMVLLFLSLALWLSLAQIMDWRWAALAVAGLWATAALGLYAIGRDHLRRMQAPERTIATLKEIPDALSGR
jgi:predicted MFS family arabinose efflux permease